MGIEWSRDCMTSHHGQTRDPNKLIAQYLENSRRCNLATIAKAY